MAAFDHARRMIAEAARAYELARAADLHRRQEAEGEQARLHDLLDEVQALQESASFLIEKAGLAYVLEPERVPPLPSEQIDAGTTEAMSPIRDAHVAFVDLRGHLLALAKRCQEKSQFADTCQILEALAETPDLPLANDARDLLPGAYEAMLIGEINGGRVRQAVQNIAERMYRAPTAEAAQAALSSVLMKALVANHHQASALAAVALGPLQAVSLEQRQELASRPECLDQVRKETGCVALQSWQFAQPEESEEISRYALVHLLTIGNTGTVGAFVSQEFSSFYKTGIHFSTYYLQIIVIPHGSTIRRSLISSVDIVPKSLVFALDDALIHVYIMDDDIRIYDIERDTWTKSKKGDADAESVARSFDGEFLSRAMTLADGNEVGRVVRAAASGDGLYAVVISTKGVITTLARTLSPSTSLGNS